ncbi:MAG: hypothetical protein ACEPOW_07985 [Bacteroidales bacterium]
MNTSEIEKLIEKFYNGNSSVQEEEILKNYFSKENVAPHLQSLKAHFIFLNQEKSKEIDDHNFENRFEEALDNEKIFSLRRIIHLKWYFASGVAACVFAVIFLFNPFSNEWSSKEKEAVKNYVELKKLFNYGNNKFNDGLAQVKTKQRINTPLSEMEEFVNIINNSSKIFKGSKKN